MTLRGLSAGRIAEISTRLPETSVVRPRQTTGNGPAGEPGVVTLLSMAPIVSLISPP